MKKQRIIIRPDGSVQFLGYETDPLIKALGGDFTAQRVSYIMPRMLLLRGLFCLIRSLAGDHSRPGNWTRTWRCRWLVDLRPSSGPVVERNPKTGRLFDSRDEAIEFEQDWLFNQE